jgi:hypothetical protein
MNEERAMPPVRSRSSIRSVVIRNPESVKKMETPKYPPPIHPKPA